MKQFNEMFSWPVVLMVSMLLLLAPFQPEPHLVGKLRMLFNGALHRPLDWFDLFLHGGIPPLLLLLKLLGSRLD